MDEFCGSEFWNDTLIWNTSSPDFTICFKKTVLAWLPCFFLWCFAALEVSYIVNSKFKDIPWNLLNSVKLFLNSIVVLLSIADLATAGKLNVDDESAIHHVDLYTPLVKIFTFVLAELLLFYAKKHGVRASGLQFLFWGLQVLCGIPQVATEIQQLREGIEYFSISFITSYICAVVMFILNWFADAEPRYSQFMKGQKPCPEDESGYFSKLLYFWFEPLAWKGFRNPLEQSDLWDMKSEYSTMSVVPQFSRHWQDTIRKCDVKEAAYNHNSTSIEFQNTSKKKEASIMPALCKTFGSTFMFGVILNVVQNVLIFVGPQILSLLITFVQEKDFAWKGCFYVILLFVASTLQTLISAQYNHRLYVVGMNIRTALVSTIYRKALRMSNSARKENTVGEIVNLVSVDAHKFVDLLPHLNLVWSAPLQILLGLYFLWNVLGPSALAGLGAMLILIPVNGYVANKMQALYIKQMENKDERVNLMNEILGGMKILKLYAWETCFRQRVLNIRSKEIKVLKDTAYVNSVTSFIWSCAPFLVSLITFLVFIYSSEENILTPQVAFVSLTLFNILKMPMSLLPILIVYVVETGVSVNRINKFLNCEELDLTCVSHDARDSSPLVVENGNFNWGEGPILKNINLRIPPGSLVAVVGPVGSGKSSLVSAFLGEMTKTSGRINTIGSIAYVSQQPWIQNATLRDNILFGRPMNVFLYETVVEACALKPDFELLAGGDLIEIGEKGINLSGGQKQRINLARALYANMDIYLLDDPLSAVDSHVGKHIFDKVIGSKGVLHKKTRILVTHAITYLPQTDLIVVMNNGEISEMGSYKELLSRKGAFAEFIVQHVSQATDITSDDGVDILKEVNLPAELVDKLQKEKMGNSSDASLKRKKSVVEEAEKESGEKLIEEEKAETGSVEWRVYKIYILAIGIAFSAAVFIFNLVFQAFRVGSDVWLSIWSTDPDLIDFNGTVNAGKRDLYLGVYGALGFGQAISVFVAALALFIGTLNGAYVLHDFLLNNILKAPMSFFDVTPLGRILNRFSTDIDAVDNTLPLTLRGWLNCFYMVLSTIVMISFTTPIFIAVIVPIGIIYYFIQRFYVATSRQLNRLESISRSPIYSHLGESVAGAAAIRAFKEQERFIGENESRVDLNQACYYPTIIANRWLAIRLEMIGNLIILFTALFAVLSKDQNPGLVGLSISYALMVTQALQFLVCMTSDIETNVVAVERINEYGEVRSEAEWEIPDKLPPKTWPESGAVEFKNYSVRYRDGLDLVLKKINFLIIAGEKVGVVGRTGSGKSTLTLSLFRIIEASEGKILIDGINIQQLGLHDLRSRITVIPQDCVLFSGSLRMNLDPEDKYTDDEIWTTLEHANLKNFVRENVDGLSYKITEGGENLSVGQRQLVCLCRALLRNTKVLILDEATAAIDLETDDQVQKMIRTQFDNCTVITIAHRLNTVLDCDRVIVLDKGEITEFDTPSKLMQNRTTIFYSMCKDAGLI